MVIIKVSENSKRLMAAFRKISITYWADRFIQSLTPEQKYFYLFLMTNTRTTQCGIYEMTLTQMCFETGYNSETVCKLMAFFEKTGKIKWSKKTDEVALLNWRKYNSSDSPKVLSCIEKELKQVKNKDLIQYLYIQDTEPQKEEEKEEEKTKEEDTRFELFWTIYDKKINRIKCAKLWAKLSEQDRSKILDTVRAYVGSTPDKTYRKHPTTYLNGRAWEDEIIAKPKQDGVTKALKQSAGLKELIRAKYGTEGAKPGTVTG